jgi:iron complex transport system ATP-binding protein
VSSIPIPLLEADRVNFSRGRRPVINAASIAFPPGEWTAIVGPNGAGKSTLLALLAGLLRPRSGQVRLGGRLVGEWGSRERARRLAWLGQTAAAEGDIAAHEVVRLGRLPHFGLLGAPTTDDESAVAAALEETDAVPIAHRRLRELSTGERQRVLLGRVFAANASVLLLDEPTMHLDAPHQRRLVQGFRARARAGAAVVSVLHDLTLALAADRLIVVADGVVKSDGRPDAPGVREALRAVFDHAFTIEAVGGADHSRWVAVPDL